MTANIKKSHILNIKGALKTNLMGNPLEPLKSQLDLVLIVHQKLKLGWKLSDTFQKSNESFLSN